MKKITWKIIAVCLLIVETPIYIISLIMLCLGYLLAGLGNIGNLMTRFNKWLKGKFFKEIGSYQVTVTDPTTNDIVAKIRCKTEDEANAKYDDYFAKGYNVTIYNNFL